MKVLLIDDEQPIIEMYKDKLVSAGFEVVTATDGESGLKQAKESSPDVIFLDVIMPKMNGLDVLKALKATPETKHIPVYLLTNIPEDTNVQKGKELGASDYLLKAEIEPGKLVDILKDLKTK